MSRCKQNILETNSDSRTKMFPLGVVVREELPDLQSASARPDRLSVYPPAFIAYENSLCMLSPPNYLSLFLLCCFKSLAISLKTWSLCKSMNEIRPASLSSLSHNAFTLAIVMSYYTFRKHWKCKGTESSSNKCLQVQFLNTGQYRLFSFRILKYFISVFHLFQFLICC